MKKLYIQPATIVVDIKTQPLMVVSGDKGDVHNVTVTEEEFTGGSGEILSRRYSAWDDEELEEEEY